VRLIGAKVFLVVSQTETGKCYTTSLCKQVTTGFFEHLFFDRPDLKKKNTASELVRTKTFSEVDTGVYRCVQGRRSLDMRAQVFTHVYKRVQLCIRAHECVHGCTGVPRRAQMFTNVYKSVHGCTSAYNCVRMLYK